MSKRLQERQIPRTARMEQSIFPAYFLWRKVAYPTILDKTYC